MRAGVHLTFLGATGTVTGSKYLLTSGHRQVLIDCGLFQGYKQLRLRNWAPLPVDPAKLSAVVLTHAHLDHSGYVPLLVKHGFRGKVFCTESTYELCRILLPDSGHLQEEDADYANRKGFSKHHPALPLYTEQEAMRALTAFAPIPAEAAFTPVPGVEVTLRPSGHILGACAVIVATGNRTIVFSGDLGRPRDIIMRAPQTIAHADYLVVESTYGDRVHPAIDPRVQLADVIGRTAARGGVVIVPSFAVGRAQSLLYYIHLLKAEGRIPSLLPVYLNSPMAADVTQLYRRFGHEHRLTTDECEAMCRAATVVKTSDDSRRLNDSKWPMVIIAASGMATGGRVLHHLKAFASDPRASILLTGFQAGGTRGDALLQGAAEIKIHGQYVPVRAEVSALDSLSAHADYREILDWLGGFEAAPRRTFVTHGEPGASDSLRRRITESLGWTTEVPEHLQQVELT